MKTDLNAQKHDDDPVKHFMCESRGSRIEFNETWKLKRLKTEILSVLSSPKSVEC